MAAPVEIDVILEGLESSAAASQGISANVEKIGLASRSASDVLNQSFTSMEQKLAAHKTAMSQLDVAITQTKAALAAFDNEIAKATALEEADSEAVRELARDAALLKGVLNELTTQKAALGAEAALLKNQIAQTSEKSLTASSALRAMTLESKLLHESLGFNGRAMGSLVSMFQAFNPLVLIGTLAVGYLVTKLAELLHAKETVLKVDLEQSRTDAIQATLTGDRLRLNADVIASLHTIAAEQQKYRERTTELHTALDALATKGVQTKTVYNNLGIASQEIVRGTKELQEHIGSLTTELGNQDKAMAPAINSLYSIRNLYGLNTDGLIKMAQALGFANKGTEEDARSLQFLREQLDADLPSLRALANELGNVTNQLFDTERAALQTALAIRQIKPPKLDLDFMRSQQAGESPNERIRRAMDVASKAMSGGLQPLGPIDPAKLEAAIRPTLRDIRDEFRKNAAEIAANKEEAKALYNTYVGQLDPAFQGMIQRVDRSNENMKVFTEHHKSGAAAARSLAIATAELNEKLEQAKAARDQAMGVTTSFEKQEANVRAAIKLERDKLEQNNQLTVANNLRLRELETVQMTTIAAKRQEVERQLQERLGQIEAAAYAKASEDKVALLRAEISKRYDAEADFVRKSGVSEQSQASYLLSVRLALEAEYLTKRKQMGDEARKYELEQERKLDEAKVEADIKRLKEASKHALDFLKAEHARDVDRVASAFGHASQNAHAFQLQLQALQKLNKGTFFSGISASLKALTMDMLTSGKGAQDMASLLVSAFNDAASSGDDFIATLGASLIKGMTQIVAQVLAQMGVLLISKGIADVLRGIAINADPFTPGMGSALIAAGWAEIAKGAVFSAAAGLVAGAGALAANSINGHGSAANTAAGSTSAASTSASSVASNGRAPTVVSFPTSGRSGPSVINVHLDPPETRRWWDDQMERKGMVSVDTARRQHNKQLKEALGVS